jgi:hypothetical protein
MNVNLKILPPDLAGEILVHLCFKDRYEIRPEFYSVLQNQWPIDKVVCYFDATLPIHAYENLILTVIYQDDGDRTLIIVDRLGDEFYVNTDAKKAYGWKREKLT